MNPCDQGIELKGIQGSVGALRGLKESQGVLRAQSNCPDMGYKGPLYLPQAFKIVYIIGGVTRRWTVL